jgi:hypothetical protein
MILGQVSVITSVAVGKLYKNLQLGVLPILAHKWCVAVQALKLVNNNSV